VLDTRSGQLLTSQSFKETFSQLQFARHGVSYLLHKSTDPAQEEIELHHLDLDTKAETLVTRFTHAPHMKVRPSLWRGSLSPDGSFLVYQQDALVPSITIVDGTDGRTISQIRWEEDLTALPVHIDPHNELIVIPLARWDAKYQYGTNSKLLVANVKTGRILGQYEMSHNISHVRFQENQIVLIDSADNMGHLVAGSPAISWKPMQRGRQHFLYANAKGAGFFSKPNNDEAGEFQLLSDAACASGSRFTLEKGYLPVGLRGDMLVSEKYKPRELPGWLQKINDRLSSLCGRYLVSPLIHVLRYQDAATGEQLIEHQYEERNMNGYVLHRAAGATRLTTIALEEDHLGVVFYELFPFWNVWKIALLATLLTAGWGCAVWFSPLLRGS